MAAHPCAAVVPAFYGRALPKYIGPITYNLVSWPGRVPGIPQVQRLTLQAMFAGDIQEAFDRISSAGVFVADVLRLQGLDGLGRGLIQAPAVV